MTKRITFKEIRSKAKGNPFLVLDNGRFPNPWLSPDDLQAILDNEAEVRAFIARHRSAPVLTVVPSPVVSVTPARPVAPATEPQRETPPAPAEPVAAAPAPPAPDINPRVAALVSRALGNDPAMRLS